VEACRLTASTEPGVAPLKQSIDKPPHLAPWPVSAPENRDERTRPKNPHPPPDDAHTQKARCPMPLNPITEIVTNAESALDSGIPTVVIRRLKKPHNRGGLLFSYSVRGPAPWKRSLNYAQFEEDAVKIAEGWRLSGGILPAIHLIHGGQITVLRA